MVKFQILDVYSQDQYEVYATANEKQVTLEKYVEDTEEKQTKLKEIEYSKYEMLIHLFGKTEKGESIHVSVEGFQPHFYVELPDAFRKTQEDFISALKKKLPKKLFEALAVEHLYKEKLYGYTAKKMFSFMKLSVGSIKGFRAVKNYFLSQKNESIFKFAGTICKVYEANLDPMLRFFHLQDIQPCGWVEIDTPVQAEIDVHWSDVKAYNKSTQVAPFCLGFWDIECYSSNGDFPLAKKNYTKIANQLFEEANDAKSCTQLLLNALNMIEGPIDTIQLKKKVPYEEIIVKDSFQKLLSEAFETSDVSLLIKALNHLPIAGDPVIQIGIVLTDGSGKLDKHICVYGSCDPVEDTTVHSYTSESAMIIGFLELLQKHNPDILIGYNVFGFDERYLYERMEELGLTQHEHFQSLSRIENIPVELQKKFLSSSALGDNNLYLWTTTGRLHIDLYFYIKRIENLASYKLDDVCLHYMSGKLKEIDISSKETWVLKTNDTKDAEVGKYLVLLDEIGDTIVEKRKIVNVSKNSISLEAPKESFTSDDLTTVIQWAIVKDDVSPAEIFRLHKSGGSAGRATVANYCIQDCVLVYQLYKKLDVFNNAMAMANTCSVPVGYIFTRGQGIKCESLIFKECALRNQLIETLVNPLDKSDDDYVGESYEGAIVLVPTPNFYATSPIGVADFASLYPSTIYSENISYDTLLWSKDYDLSNNFTAYSFGSEKYLQGDEQYTDIEFDIWGTNPKDTRKNPEKIKLGTRICRYVQRPDDKKGTLPDIISKLLAARKAKRKLAEQEDDPFKKALLDAEQLAYKLTANSLYGQLGSSTFKVRLQQLAASTTAYGRKQIMFAKEAIEQFYGPSANDPRCSAEIVYGDTDSLFINFKVKNETTGELLTGSDAINATMELTTEAGKFVTRCLKKPHDFEYDKVFYPFIIFSKKRYVGNKYEGSAISYKQTSMGIATKRRDYAPIVKNIYGGAIKILLEEKDSTKAFNFVKRIANDLVDGKISTHQLTMSKSLRSEYKSASPPAHKVLAERIKARDPGNAPSSGDRLEFMYILPPVGQVASKLQGERVETPAFIKEHKLKIDTKYYIEHQIYNPIVQLFGLFVTELPGYKSSSKSLSIEEREMIAGDLLFRDIYAKCNNQKVHTFAEKFGFTVQPSTRSTVVKNRSQNPVQLKSTIKKDQMINLNKLDRFLVQKTFKKSDLSVVGVDA